MPGIVKIKMPKLLREGNMQKKHMYRSCIAIVLIIFAGSAYMGGFQDSEAVESGSQTIEIGLVNWSRDFEGALERSRHEGKPVLVLFQEVPGCSGTQQFGKDVLSHPHIVEAIENEFIPVLIYNNRDGWDAEMLAQYNEPAWNYQVIRFLDSFGNDIIPRKDRIWTLSTVAARLIEALRAAGRNVPLYLQGLAHEEGWNSCTGQQCMRSNIY
jgi:hypothetical protein